MAADAVKEEGELEFRVGKFVRTVLVVGLGLLGVTMAIGAPRGEAARLGKARQMFGEKYAYTSKGYMDHYKWMYYFHMEGAPTVILFPFGVASTRFYFSEFDDGKYDPVHRETIGVSVFYLNCQRKVGKRIDLLWMIRLEDCPVPHTFKGMGTLQAMLARWGLRAAKTLSPQVAHALKARTQYAAYVMPPILDPACWTVREDGQESEHIQADLYTTPNHVYPVTRSPYPITKEERAWIKAHSAAKNGGQVHKPAKRSRAARN